MDKKSFKGLAKILGILSLWMSAGWALYPYLLERVASAMGEAVNMDEVRLFSIAMTVTCIGVGIILLAYGFSKGKAQ